MKIAEPPDQSIDLMISIPRPILQAVIISDTHSGSRLALCPPDGVDLDDGGKYEPSVVQLKMWCWYMEFIEWVKKVTRDEPFIFIHNGDALEGCHHGDMTNFSANPVDQRRCAETVLQPLVDLCKARGGQYHQVRGTEAHVGKSASEEETMARNLGAEQNEEGKYSSWELWCRLGGETGPLCNFMHHIGTTSSSAHETSAVNAELTAMFTDAGRFKKEPPMLVCRSHRHRASKIELPTEAGDAISMVTPAWQLKTPFAWKKAGARTSTPQIGGCLARLGETDGGIYVRTKLWDLGRSRVVVPFANMPLDPVLPPECETEGNYPLDPRD